MPTMKGTFCLTSLLCLTSILKVMVLSWSKMVAPVLSSLPVGRRKQYERGAEGRGWVIHKEISQIKTRVPPSSWTELSHMALTAARKVGYAVLIMGAVCPANN